jgi:hypothetical protein
MRWKLPIVSLFALLVIASGCLGGGGTATSSSQQTHQSFSPTSTTHSKIPPFRPTVTTTSHTSSTITTSSHMPSTTALSSFSEVLDILSGIESYRVNMQTNITFTVKVLSGTVSRIENVSIYSNESAFFAPSLGEMELNITALTYPAGGVVETRMVFLNETAYVTSLGSVKVIRKGEEGYGSILGALESNPLSIVLEALRSGSCSISGGKEDFEVSCSEVSGLTSLKKLVEISVGGKNSSDVDINSGWISLKIKNGVPVSGMLMATFRVSGSSMDIHGNIVDVTQEGTISRSFQIEGVNENPPLSH